MNRNTQTWAIVITFVLHLVALIWFYFLQIEYNPKPQWTTLKMNFAENEILEKPKSETPDIPENYEPRNLNQRKYSIAKTNEAVNEAIDQLSKGERERLEQQVEEQVSNMAKETSTTGFMEANVNSGMEGNSRIGVNPKPKTDQKKSGTKEGTADEGNVHDKATNISYYLKDRKLGAIGLYNPVYLCQAGGVVVVNIVVSPQGDVLSASVNENKTETRNPCLKDAARQAALQSTFNNKSDAPSKQRGIITYRFVEQ